VINNYFIFENATIFGTYLPKTPRVEEIINPFRPTFLGT
jgi:hypothetical protein